MNTDSGFAISISYLLFFLHGEQWRLGHVNRHEDPEQQAC